MPEPAEHRIEVTGAAVAEVPPDRARWLLRVVERDRELQLAFDRCAVRASAVAEALERELEGEVEVTTRGVRLGRHWEGGRDGGPEATAEVNVTTAVADAGQAARVAMDAGADLVEGPWFGVRDAADRRERLIADAVRAARRKAEHAAAAAERRLGRAVRVVEGADDPGWAPGARMMALQDGPEPRVDAEDQRMSAVVRVTFELLD